MLSVTPTISLPERQATSQGSFVAIDLILLTNPFSSVSEYRQFYPAMNLLALSI